MAASIGTMGKIEVWEDFMGFTSTTMSTLGRPQGGHGVMYSSVEEGSFSQTVNEPGGILACVTDTGNNDSLALHVGPFVPADGGVVMEVRFKVLDITTTAVYAGFTEALDTAAPIMPAEFSSEAFTYNGTEGMVGIQFDKNATTTDWRALAGDAGVAKFDADSDNSRAHNPPVNDNWDVVRVEIDPDATARVWLADKSTGSGLRLIKTIKSAVAAGDLQTAVLMVENRTAATNTMEVDYFYARGYVDWTR